MGSSWENFTTQLGHKGSNQVNENLSQNSEALLDSSNRPQLWHTIKLQLKQIISCKTKQQFTAAIFEQVRLFWVAFELKVHLKNIYVLSFTNLMDFWKTGLRRVIRTISIILYLIQNFLEMFMKLFRFCSLLYFCRALSLLGLFQPFLQFQRHLFVTLLAQWLHVKLVEFAPVWNNMTTISVLQQCNITNYYPFFKFYIFVAVNLVIIVHMHKNSVICKNWQSRAIM